MDLIWTYSWQTLGCKEAAVTFTRVLLLRYSSEAIIVLYTPLLFLAVSVSNYYYSYKVSLTHEWLCTIGPPVHQYMKSFHLHMNASMIIIHYYTAILNTSLQDNSRPPASLCRSYPSHTVIYVILKISTSFDAHTFTLFNFSTVKFKNHLLFFHSTLYGSKSHATQTISLILVKLDQI